MHWNRFRRLTMGALLIAAFALGVALQSVWPFVRPAGAQSSALSGSAPRTDPSAPAGSATQFTYQGRLTGSSGAPVNSAVNVVFRLYDAASTAIYTSSVRSITPVNGLFTVYLGGGADPNLFADTLASAATIGVTVGGDAEMTPRQPLNTLAGHSDSASGVIGSSNTAYGVQGVTNSGAGVLGLSTTLNGVGVAATGGGPTGMALQVYNGGIRITGAGVGSSTAAFIHVVTADNITPSHPTSTTLSNPLIDGDPNAILLVTPVCYYGPSGVCSGMHPAGASYTHQFISFPSDKWLINNLDGVNMVAGMQYSVLVLKP